MVGIIRSESGHSPSGEIQRVDVVATVDIGYEHQRRSIE